MKTRRETSVSHEQLKRQHQRHRNQKRRQRYKRVPPAVRAELGEPTHKYGRGRDIWSRRKASLKRALKFEARDEQEDVVILDPIDPEDYFSSVFGLA